MDMIGKQDPYVKLTLDGGEYEKRTKTIVDGGVSPFFAEEQLLLW